MESHGNESEDLHTNGEVRDMKHPPLCPGVKDFWWQSGGHIWCPLGNSYDGQLVKAAIARYQACAWQDRADELERLSFGFDDNVYEACPTCDKKKIVRHATEPSGYEAACQARMNAFAWREWERGE